MTGHAHHEHHGASLTQEAQTTLEAAGQQWTEMRALIFDVLATFKTPASAYDIAEKVSTRRDKRVAPNSVYRILDLFVETNLAQRVESANAYVANSHPGCVHDCIFMICGRCGEVTHVDNDRIANGVRDTAAASGFTPDRPVIEVHGTCAACD